MNKLILASGSPRRRELLTLLGYPFEVIPADIDEEINLENDLVDEIEALSFKKALAVFKEHSDSVVIGSDTIVTIDGEVLGKPRDEEDAFKMLKRLQGNVHEVITGVSIITPKQSESFSNVSKVYFDTMSDDEIRNYIATKEPLDKAGAYGLQGIGGQYIKKIDGDFYSIIGFPINQISKSLKKYM